MTSLQEYGSSCLLAMRMVVAVPVFALVGAQQWRQLRQDARPDLRTVGLAMLVGILGY